jgi:hypothetical protein
MEAELANRREAQATIDAVMAAIAEELDHLGQDEPDPKHRALLQEGGQLMKRDIADLIAMARRVTEPEFQLPPKPLTEDPPESG